MFGFGKKKTKEPKKETTEEAVLTIERKDELLRTISIKKEEVNQAVGEERAKIYEEIGLAFNELGDEDHAIDSLEKSIQAKKSLGDGYKTLLKLYNKKRAEAAKVNNEELLQIYLKKMDQMMQVSKEVTRGVR
ncbi:tetratricopeptide repeat protein [Metabacillus sediminilitoris]|uniref:Tetratricopeptide repeat protein n=1 Tax=Metabacillus sediminilitoris TaxID=2567941 RepID=A0A4S4BVT6_9BACI|nr:tetratricopeptide repeat protein [Metabacillus sediminilitoris]QGQ44908.1 tetratricopeptide repeat protein [Metabacillus sediminilitoris]THF78541.1 tetratricopeptide repeat protein [Metabacillus sediminilitoris]